MNGVESMVNMITVKEYASDRKITIQAVHKSMKGARKAERLKGHVFVQDGIKWLDDVAVRILDESRKQAPATILMDDRQAEIDALNEKIAKLEKQLEGKENYIMVLEQAGTDKQARLNELEGERKLIEEKTQKQINDAVKAAEAAIHQRLTSEHQKKIEDMTAAHEQALAAEKERKLTLADVSRFFKKGSGR